MSISKHLWKLQTGRYLQLLEDYTASKSLRKGKSIHQSILRHLSFNPHDRRVTALLLSKLTRFYIACNEPSLAHRVFEVLPSAERRCRAFLYNQIIRLYAWEGPFKEAIDLFHEMVNCGTLPTKYTFPVVLKACASLQDFDNGVKIHDYAKRLGLDSDVYVCTALIDFYAKCGCLVEAREVFDAMREKDIVVWNAMISGSSLRGLYWDMLKLVLEMQEMGLAPNSSTALAMLQALGEAKRVSEGKAVHGYCVRRGFEDDVVVATGILDMYGKCRFLSYARKTFCRIDFKNEITWSAMIGAYISCEREAESLKTFRQMIAERCSILSPITLAIAIHGCAKLNDVSTGKQIHCYSIKSGIASDLMVGNTLLTLYSNCKIIDHAIKYFSEMESVDCVSYNAMISGYVDNGNSNRGLQMFCEMQFSGFFPELATMKIVLSACSHLVALRHGTCAHGYSAVRGYTEDVTITNALIDMYSKCGKIDDARLVFDQMHNKDVVSWNTMIGGYGIHGFGKRAILLFHDMITVGQQPDDLTFISLLFSCSHSGLVTEGKQLFSAMIPEFNIVPRLDHYLCMVDLLARAGLLDEALSFIQEMPLQPDINIWNTLLAACRIHKNTELGGKVSSEIQSLGLECSGELVNISNLYSTLEKWDDVQDVRASQKDLGIKKGPGCSWVEVSNASQRSVI